MQLLVAHQILITSALGLAVLFGLRSMLLFSRGQGAANLALAAVSVTVALALGAYLRSVRARWLEQKARRADRRPRS